MHTRTERRKIFVVKYFESFSLGGRRAPSIFFSRPCCFIVCGSTVLRVEDVLRSLRPFSRQALMVSTRVNAAFAPSKAFVGVDTTIDNNTCYLGLGGRIAVLQACRLLYYICWCTMYA